MKKSKRETQMYGECSTGGDIWFHWKGSGKKYDRNYSE
jgi:hypothetical protein